ncbi:phosphate ABC transporter substrate-binding protein [Pseudoalteromonas xiamenensis]|uniref:Phosphate ABC transporter substrate-binding protein n=1 Tax=Pseudoalteromonas xiamenensis TaxID=882626 RepID=A0A975DKA5_9GAMM|nr:phosphate ABC transporter substrate-binding protein [Pseudoalteromonas xiamenensis]QTH73099.1 phosphate ABC transporter substrate-binding protein [Pseudoalteromonas xiamenensis]WMN62172.1 phosphate ABC transporter substrate-binding protein [Pseudoalteromonas xiamenensis]
MIKYSLISLALLSASASAGVAVVVHPSNTSALDAAAINRIFTGKEKAFSNGNKVIPIGQDSGTAATGEFNEKVLNKTAAQLKAYWSKLVFTGKGTPPKEVSNDQEVIKLISSNPDTIGYVSTDAVDASVKVVMEF